MHTEQYWRLRDENDKSDWATDETWLDSYWESRTHPHRDAILKELEWIEPTSLLEIGCNVGPNLYRILEDYPRCILEGIDPSEMAVDRAQINVPEAYTEVGDVVTMEKEEGAYSVVLADAALMYVPPEEILKAVANMDRATSNAIIIVDRHSPSILGEPYGNIWHRDYGEILKGFGYKVDTRKLTPEEWPTSQGWIEHGYIWTARK